MAINLKLSATLTCRICPGKATHDCLGSPRVRNGAPRKNVGAPSCAVSCKAASCGKQPSLVRCTYSCFSLRLVLGIKKGLLFQQNDLHTRKPRNLRETLWVSLATSACVLCPWVYGFPCLLVAGSSEQEHSIRQVSMLKIRSPSSKPAPERRKEAKGLASRRNQKDSVGLRFMGPPGWFTGKPKGKPDVFGEAP